jgi:hypothetical protein
VPASRFMNGRQEPAFMTIAGRKNAQKTGSHARKPGSPELKPCFFSSLSSFTRR